MLIRFRASNFRSLRDEQELSMVAAFPEARKDLIHLKELELDLVRVAGIYGANAAGKSNILEALLFLKNAVRDSHREWPPEGPIPREPFLLDVETLTAASTFEIDFAMDGILYQYGFSLNSERILEEWLHAYPQKHKQIWFSRHQDSFTFSRHLRGNNKTIEQLTRKNSLFLSAAAQNNHQGLAPIHLWLTGKLDFYRNNDFYARGRQMSSRLLVDEHFRSNLLNYLRLADLGIEDIGVHQEIPTASASITMLRQMVSNIPYFCPKTLEFFDQSYSTGPKQAKRLSILVKNHAEPKHGFYFSSLF